MPWVIHYRLENFEHLRNVESSFSDCLHIMKCLLATHLTNVRLDNLIVEDKFQALMVGDVMVKHLETETVSCGVQDPGVIIGTLDAGVEPQCLPRQFSRCEGAGVG